VNRPTSPLSGIGLALLIGWQVVGAVLVGALLIATGGSVVTTGSQAVCAAIVASFGSDPNRCRNSRSRKFNGSVVKREERA
jgi:hypothetical protein